MSDDSDSPVGIVKDGEFLFVLTVYTAPGKLKVNGENFSKSRIWVLENRDVYAVTRAGNGADVARMMLGKAASMAKTTRRQLDITLEDGSIVQLLESSCGCGMGAVASAGPIEGPWRMRRVRIPDWFDANAYQSA